MRRQLSVLGKGRGKYLFSPSSPPVQGCPVADVTAAGGMCCDRDAAKHNQPWRLLFSAARGGGRNRKQLSILIFLFYCYWKSALSRSQCLAGLSPRRGSWHWGLMVR